MIKRSQTMLEFALLLTIIVAALLTMQVYIKRGIQGRWKQALDDMGEQYDVNGFYSNLRYTLNSISESQTSVVAGVTYNGQSGLMTYRNDTSYSVEKKQGSTMMLPGQ